MTDILIAEDDREPADLLTDFLRAEGNTVSSVNSGGSFYATLAVRLA